MLGLLLPLDQEHLEAGIMRPSSAHWVQREPQKMFAG